MGLEFPRFGAIALAGIAAAAISLEACTLYEGCYERYGDERSMGAPLTEACSRGVTFSRKFSREWAERHCNGNYFEPVAQEACYYGIHLARQGREGAVYRDGLDD